MLLQLAMHIQVVTTTASNRTRFHQLGFTSCYDIPCRKGKGLLMNPQGYDKADEKYFNSMETVTRWASTAASPLSNTPASADRKVSNRICL